MLTMGGYECRGRNLRAALEQDHEKKCQDAHRHTRKDSRSSSNKVSTAFTYCWHHVSANQYTFQNRGQCNGQDYTEVSKHQEKQLSPSSVSFHHVLWSPTKITHIISDLTHIISAHYAGQDSDVMFVCWADAISLTWLKPGI